MLAQSIDGFCFKQVSVVHDNAPQSICMLPTVSPQISKIVRTSPQIQYQIKSSGSGFKIQRTQCQSREFELLHWCILKREHDLKERVAAQSPLWMQHFY